MDKSLVLKSAGTPRVVLRGATAGDLEELRAWKNAEKRWFFFKGDITMAMQEEWFGNYLRRADDVLFIVEYEGRKAGTIGLRLLKDGSADIYNVIAAPGYRGKGLMKAALATLCSYAAGLNPAKLSCLVLKGNPAAKFYESCGFRRAGGDEIHDAYELTR